MKFFIPNAPSDKAAESLYQYIRKSAPSAFGATPSDKRIYQLTFWENGKAVTAEIGKPTVNGEIVVAILEIGAYLICTPSQGIAGGMPAIVGADEVLSVVEFD